MSFSDEDVSEERIKRSVNDWRTKYPLASAIFDKIPTMDLGEVVGTMYLVDVVKKLVKMRALRLSVEEGKEPLDLLDDKLSDQKVEEKINVLKNRYPTALVSLKEYITWILKKPQLQCLRLIQWSHY